MPGALDESLKSRTNCMGTRRNNAPIGNIAEKKSKGFEKPKKRITANTFPTEASDACNHAKGKKNVRGIRTEKKNHPDDTAKINNMERIKAPDTLRRIN